MTRNNILRAVSILNELRESLGVRHPGSSVLTINQENLANEVKHKANLSVELFDEHIRKLVDAFFEFSVVYRENHADRFIDDIKTIIRFFYSKDRGNAFEILGFKECLFKFGEI